jgi:hypothetical protein
VPRIFQTKTGNIFEFSPSDSIETIKAAVQVSLAAQKPGQADWVDRSFAFLFHPGVYDFGGWFLQVPFQTSVRGLGLKPSDTVLKNCIVSVSGCPDNCPVPATDIFWRDVENLEIGGWKPPGWQNLVGMQWYTSQACPVRRVKTARVELDSPVIGGMWASGGFFADVTADTVFSQTQQQFCFRSLTCPDVENQGGMNWVFVDSDVKMTSSCDQGRTILVESAGRELPRKPYLSERGVVLANGSVAGFADVDIFYSGATAVEINASTKAAVVLAGGDYKSLGGPLRPRRGQVLLGVGWPVLHAEASGQPIVDTSDSGVVVAGILVQAGTGNPDALVRLAKPGTASSLFDVFVRLLTPGAAKTMVTVEQDQSYLEDLWLWVADHQPDGSTDWTRMNNPVGLAVSGNDVAALGLAVEHQSANMVSWTGARGWVRFFQAEFPYGGALQQQPQPAYSVSGPAHQLSGGGVYYVLPSPTTGYTAFEGPQDMACNGCLAKNWQGLDGVWTTLRAGHNVQPPEQISAGQSFTVC